MENTAKRHPSLNQYFCLERSGLRGSPLCLGAMTFGTEWSWGSPADTAQRILDTTWTRAVISSIPPTCIPAARAVMQGMITGGAIVRAEPKSFR